MGAGLTPETIRTERRMRNRPPGRPHRRSTARSASGAPVSGRPLGWVAAFVVAAALRLPRLDGWALDVGEAARAYDAWVLFRGQPSATGEAIPDVGALLVLLEGMAFFLFGATDVTARLVSALAGLALVAVPFSLRRWVGGPAALGMAALAALSPTLVYASRIVVAGDRRGRAGAGRGRVPRTSRRAPDRPGVRPSGSGSLPGRRMPPVRARSRWRSPS